MILRNPAASLVVALLLGSGTAAVAADPDDGSLAPRTAESGAPLSAVQQAMDLPHLALALEVEPATRSIRATADYTIRATGEIERIEFDLDPRFTVTQVTLDGAALASDRWSSHAGLLAIALPASLAVASEVRVAISYHGAPRVAPRAPWDGGFVWAETSDGRPWVATAVQGEGCDLFWPCLDHPSKRAGLVDLAITVPEGLVAASNGRLVGQETADGRTTWRWQARRPNNYGISLQIGPYELAEANYSSRFGNSIPIRFWHLPGEREGAERLVAELQAYLDFFESTIGPYPWSDEKVGLAQTPHLGMEHQTINAYGEGYKLGPEGYDWLLLHEFSHEWFANQLSNANNADMWLQEGLGTYMQPLFLRWRSGEAAYGAAMWDLRKKIGSRVPLAPRGYVSSTYYNDREAGWGGDIYYKGAWIAHTLRGLVGDAAFFAALTRVVYGRDDPEPGNFDVTLASTDDFQAIVEQVSGRKLDWFFEAYFRTAELPRLEVVREGTSLQLNWATGSPIPFAMPVDVMIEGRRVTVPMTGGVGVMQLPAPDTHVVIDPDARVLRDDPAITAWQAQEARPAAANN